MLSCWFRSEVLAWFDFNSETFMKAKFAFFNQIAPLGRPPKAPHDWLRFGSGSA